MPRPKKKQDYDEKKIMQEFMEAVAGAFGQYDDRAVADRKQGMRSLNAVAAEFNITSLKARKLLITAGAYSTVASRRVQELTASGMTIRQVMEVTGLSRASVHSYLPYTKIPYNLEELSVNAERTKLYRARKEACTRFADSILGLSAEEQDEALWRILGYLQGCVFFTAKGLKFTYTLKGGELFVNRKSKSITRATVNLAFHKALELGAQATGPKKLGTFGASYLFPVFMRIGIIGNIE